MSELTFMWSLNLNSFISSLTQDKIMMNEIVLRKQIFDSSYNENEVVKRIKKWLKKVRKQKEINLLNEIRWMNWVFKHMISHMQLSNTQKMRVKNEKDLKEKQKQSENKKESEMKRQKKSKKKLKKNLKEKDKNDENKDLRSW